jgi:hypothetical protein
VSAAQSRFRLPSTTLILTPAGASPASEVQAGDKLLTLVSGSPRWAPVLHVETAPARARLLVALTAAGPVIVHPEARLETARGPVAAAELGEGDSLEALAPSDIPACPAPKVALAGADTLSTLIPQANGCADSVVEDLTTLARDGAFELTTDRDDRWLAVRLTRTIRHARRWSWARELALIRALCAWSTQDGRTELRLRAGDDLLTALLRRALIATHTSFAMSWTPAFLPVEARIALSEPKWRPFVPVQLLRAQMGTARSLLVQGERCALVSDLAVIRPVV